MLREMRGAVILTTTVIAAALAVILSLGSLSDRILQSETVPPQVRLLIAGTFPPKGLYNYLACEELNIREAGSIQRLVFENRYAGRHEAGIVLTSFPVELYRNHRVTLGLRVSFYSEGRLLLSRLVDSEYTPFLGKKDNGFTALIYRAPSDLPLRKPIVCEVEVVKPDQALADAYGPIKFYVRKMSDK